jgi:hypothetical protein
MSYTYAQENVANEAEPVFVPSYARRSAAKPKKFKTWMVLAPIAGVVLVGGAAVMLMNSGGEAAQPLAEPAVAPAVIAPAAPLSSTPAPVTAAPAATVAATPAPVVREAEPVRRAAPAPVRRTAPVASRVEAPVEPTGPRAYQASPSATPSLNAPVTAAPAPRIATPPVVAPAPVTATPPAPSIPVSPLN